MRGQMRQNSNGCLGFGRACFFSPGNLFNFNDFSILPGDPIAVTPNRVLVNNRDCRSHADT